MQISQKVIMLLLLSLILISSHQLVSISEATVGRVSFGSFACDETTMNRRCVSASMEIVRNVSSNSVDSFSYSSYDNGGIKVDLGTTLRIDVRVLSSKARVFFVRDSKIIYNKYEWFEPSVSCAVTPMSSCFDGTNSNFVLCCLNGKRGTGVFCLKEEEPSSYTGLRRAYKVYRMVGTQKTLGVTLRISQNGRIRDFSFNGDSTIVSTPNVQASVSYGLEEDQKSIFSRLQKISDNYVLLRMMHLGTVNGYNQIQPSEVLLVEKLSNFLTDSYTYRLKAQCSSEFGETTFTHTDPDNKNDQFYNSETLYGIRNVLKEKFEIPQTDTTTFGNTVGDESGVDYFEFDINTPSISLNLLINNIYDI